MSGQQRSLFPDDPAVACPCGGPVTITDASGPVAYCEKCGDDLILERGRWHEFKNFFGGGTRTKPKSKRKSKPDGRRKAA